MAEIAAAVTASFVGVPDAPECEEHLAESGTIAYRVALSVLRHREDAEDVAQEAVLRTLQRFASLRDRTRFRTWLVRITWRLALDRRRADGRRAVRDFQLVAADAAGETAEHHLMARERAARVWSAIDGLPPRLRLPLVLGMLEGESLEEIAARLHVPVGTVKSRAFEARRRLKKALAGVGALSTLVVVAAVINWPRPSPPAVTSLAQPVARVSPVDAARTPPESRVRQSASPRAGRPSPASVADAGVALSMSVAPAAGPLAGVAPIALPTVHVPVVNASVLQVPIVAVHVVAVRQIEMPAVSWISTGAPDTHPERQP